MYQRHQLSNGIRVVTYPMQGMRSLSLGLWINAGSAYESQACSGVSHFVEHMLFKGTETHSAKDLADIVDGIGGQINAFTSKECTSYYIKVLDTHMDIAVDLLGDMLLRSVHDPVEIEKEKNVILDEIALYEDSPEDVVYDLLAEVIYGQHPLGFPILGSEASVKNLTRETLKALLDERYTAENIVISAAGSYKESELMARLEAQFGSVSKSAVPVVDPAIPAFKTAWGVKEKDIEQVHLCVGFEGVKYSDDDLYPLMVLNNILGGGTSSRLFQSIREDQGLAYSVYSHPSLYKDNGLMTIYASFVPENLEPVMESLCQELKNMRSHAVTLEEILRGKEQLKGNYILGLESTGSFMSMMGKSELMAGMIETIDEVIEKIDGVQPEDVFRMADRVLTPERYAVALTGRITDKEGLWTFEQLKSI